MPPGPHSFPPYAYFDCVLGRPAWPERRILDFGGGQGNLLFGPGNRIRRDRYWCLDVHQESLVKGRRDYPNAHFHFFDCYNHQYNPAGRKALEIPHLGRRFDLILAYSVFTHILRREFVDLVTQLRGLLTPDGLLAFSFIDPHYNPCQAGATVGKTFYDMTHLEYRLRRMNEMKPSVPVEALVARASRAEWCSLINEDQLFVESEPEVPLRQRGKARHFAFYTPHCVKQLFPTAEIVAPPPQVYTAPLRRELQHCALLRAS